MCQQRYQQQQQQKEEASLRGSVENAIMGFLQYMSIRGYHIVEQSSLEFSRVRRMYGYVLGPILVVRQSCIQDFRLAIVRSQRVSIDKNLQSDAFQASVL